MKKVYLILTFTLFLILISCQSQPKLQYQDEKFNEKTQNQSIKEKATVKEELPSKGMIDFSSEVKTTMPVIDETAEIEMMTTGKIDYEIDDKNIVKGSGKGKVTGSLKSDIGLAVCEGSKSIPIEFNVTGIKDPKSNEIIFNSHNVKPNSYELTLTCPSEFGDLTYQLAIPILTFVGQGKQKEIILNLKKEQITKVITHIVPDWDLPLEATWKFNLVKQNLVFDINVDPPIITLKQGNTVTPSVNVKLISGSGNVILKNTEWPTIKAFIVNKQTTPPETTTLTIETTCNTKPDQYLFTVTGESTKTFETSADSINVIVTKNPTCQ